MFVDVLLPVPVDRAFAYACSNGGFEVKVGDVVKVEFAKRKCPIFGIVVSVYDELQDCQFTVKDVLSVSPMSVDACFLEFLRAVSRYNVIPIGVVLKMGIQDFFSSMDFEEVGCSTRAVREYSGEFQILLSDEQFQCFRCLFGSSMNTVLLDGETGSGKTEVYFRLIHEVFLARPKSQVLILVPEINLTPGLIDRVSACFAEIDIFEWSSGISRKKKLLAYKGILLNLGPTIIVGTRSALFLPYPDLQLIIVDEEHDLSFKQEKSGTYNARDMAVLYANLKDIKVILVSATPSLETVYNVARGKYDKVVLKSRFNRLPMPSMKIVDVLGTNNVGSCLSLYLREEIKKHIASGAQVLLFLNKRGYSRVKVCSVCRYVVRCKNCSVALVEHIGGRLLCHYCGYNSASNLECPNCCTADSWISYGFGIERLEKEVRNLLPNARVCSISSDTKIGAIRCAIGDFVAHKIDIMIGTQMIVKSYNFPNLTLIGIVDADFGFASCDLRAAERVYQALYQVSGRVGRFSKPGYVCMQTCDPSNQVIRLLLNYERDKFYELELLSRCEAFMPPFVKLISVIVSGKGESSVSHFSSELANRFLEKKIQVLGPIPAPIFVIRKRYRYRILVKRNDNYITQQIIRNIVTSVNTPRNIKVEIDVDPVTFS